MITYRTSSADQTRALASALAALVAPGDVVLLAGELGAGKTVFAQGFGAGLDVTDRVTSPTFALHNRYEGRLRLEHIDAYRLGNLDEVADLGLPELVDDGGVVLVEWGDTITPVLPSDYLEVHLTGSSRSEDERRIRIEAVGPRWSARVRAVAEALSPWAEEESSEVEGGQAC